MGKVEVKSIEVRTKAGGVPSDTGTGDGLHILILSMIDRKGTVTRGGWLITKLLSSSSRLALVALCREARWPANETMRFATVCERSLGVD
jgi:hypothetical protein